MRMRKKPEIINTTDYEATEEIPLAYEDMPEVPEPPKRGRPFGKKAKVRASEDVKPDKPLSAEDQHLKSISDSIHKNYGNYLTPNDVASIPKAVYDAEIITLLIAILDELHDLRMAVTEEQE